ncbi:hypothetical protein FB451DRAFT_1208111 [Mycena latifolia]|nr:hypothetical protein FB451DRAFT_1208111 [Mycena latifolia]
MVHVLRATRRLAFSASISRPAPQTAHCSRVTVRFDGTTISFNPPIERIGRLLDELERVTAPGKCTSRRQRRVGPSPDVDSRPYSHAPIVLPPPPRTRSDRGPDQSSLWRAISQGASAASLAALGKAGWASPRGVVCAPSRPDAGSGASSSPEWSPPNPGRLGTPSRRPSDKTRRAALRSPDSACLPSGPVPSLWTPSQREPSPPAPRQEADPTPTSHHHLQTLDCGLLMCMRGEAYAVLTSLLLLASVHPSRARHPPPSRDSARTFHYELARRDSGRDLSSRRGRLTRRARVTSFLHHASRAAGPPYLPPPLPPSPS